MAVLVRRKTLPSIHDSPPIFIVALSTNFVLEVEGGVKENAKVIVSHKKPNSLNQQWIFEELGYIACASNSNLVLDRVSSGPGSKIIVSQRKDDLHNWNQLWEYHRGYIRTMKNHSLVLDVEYRNTNPGANVIVWKPHKKGNHENQLWGLKEDENTPYSPRLPIKPSRTPRTRQFDSHKLDPRLTKLWNLSASFGTQTVQEDIFYKIVSDRFCLVNGMQVLRDEIQLAFEKGGDLMACAIDLSQPTVMTALSHTNCGDRINNNFHGAYDSIIASRFANIAKNGELMTENFSPAGGGTDDGGVLAHVTVAHQLDENIRCKIYDGNKTSYILVNIDLMTHVGCDRLNGTVRFGEARESIFRDSRSACGAIIATLTGFDETNTVHRRLRKNLGENNFETLLQRVIIPDGTDITFVVAAAIIAIQGLYDTCLALTSELDERSVAHVTASTTINGTDTMIYFARATVFGGIWKFQGFGLDASKYSGKIVESVDQQRYLELTYDGKTGDQLKIETNKYTVKDLLLTL